MKNFFDDIVSAFADPVKVNDIGTGLDVFGRAFSAVQSLDQGLETHKAADATAANLRVQASDEAGAGERQAISEDEKAKLVMSRQLALAAPSGGGASDPTIVNLMARTAQEGAYRQATALYGGLSREQALRHQADMTEYQGKMAERAGRLNMFGGFIGAGSSLFSGAVRSSMLKKYGGKGAPMSENFTQSNDFGAY